MALSRSKKSENVQKLASELESSTSAIVGTFAGLTAAKDFALRKTIRGAGGSYHVVKNKLAARAGEGTKIEAALQGLKGVSSVAYTSGDPVALAKALSTWVKDNAEFTFKLGIIDGKVITVEEIGDLATMPGKEELFSKLLFLINSPAQRLATVINATGRDLAVVINQAVEKEKFSAAAAPAPTPNPPAPEASEPEPAPAPPEAVPPQVDVASAAPSEPTPADGQLLAAAHAEEAPTPEQQIAEHPASEADPVAAPDAAQPENGTASQAGAAATSDPVEG
jgi:large subunit ribosomal protein L10